MNSACHVSTVGTANNIDNATSSDKSVQHFTVLVVDDCKVTSRITSGLLSTMGFNVHVASDGKQGVLACSQTSYSFVLMDYQMPEMDGLEATALIRAAEKHTGVHTPIIGYSACADGRMLVAAGMDDYLPKPATASALTAKIALLFKPATP